MRDLVVPGVEGVIDTETRVKGTASPLTYAANGTIKATKLTLAKSSANQAIAITNDADGIIENSSLATSDLAITTSGGAATIINNGELTGVVNIGSAAKGASWLTRSRAAGAGRDAPADRGGGGRSA